VSVDVRQHLEQWQLAIPFVAIVEETQAWLGACDAGKIVKDEII
jgi:hypothetical protein